jgi:DNA-binding NarL/FixJ family response regulator
MDDPATRTTNLSSTLPTGARVLLIGLPDANLPLRSHPVHVHGPVWPRRLDLELEAGPFDAAIVDVDAGPVAYDYVLQLGEAMAPCRCVLLGSHLDRATVREAFLTGVVACLRKPVHSRALVGALRRAIDATRMMRRCIDEADHDQTATSETERGVDLAMLTPREAEILELVMEGRSTRKMAQHLSVSERTVKFHVSNVLRKLGAESRISLLAKMRRETW